MCFEGEAKMSKVRSAINWWSKEYISMIIIKTASRNVAFKTARMSESALESQVEVTMRRLEAADETRSDEDKQVALDDIRI